MADNMNQARAQPDDTLQVDLACPACDYNLRGLPRPIVTCPECGHVSDVTQLAVERWRLPWWKTPGFAIATRPALVAYLAAPVNLIVALTFSFNPGDAGVVLTVLLISVAVWLGLVCRAWFFFDGWLGANLVLLGHVVALCISVCFFGAAWGLLPVLCGVSRCVYGILSPMAFVIVIACGWTAHRLQRHIGKICLRHYVVHGGGRKR